MYEHNHPKRDYKETRRRINNPFKANLTYPQKLWITRSDVDKSRALLHKSLYVDIHIVIKRFLGKFYTVIQQKKI